MASAKRQSAPKATRAERRVQNRKKLDDARAPLKGLAKQVLADTFKPKIGRPKAGPGERRILPSEMSAEQIEEFRRLVIASTSIKQIAADYPHMPSETEMWIAIGDESCAFSRAYASGRALRVAALEERIEDIANSTLTGKFKTHRKTKKHVVVGQGDNAELEVVEDEVEETREQDMLGHRNLLIETLKWELSWLRPKKHGKKAEGGESSTVNDQLQALFDSLQAGPVDDTKS